MEQTEHSAKPSAAGKWWERMQAAPESRAWWNEIAQDLTDETGLQWKVVDSVMVNEFELRADLDGDRLRLGISAGILGRDLHPMIEFYERSSRRSFNGSVAGYAVQLLGGKGTRNVLLAWVNDARLLVEMLNAPEKRE